LANSVSYLLMTDYKL